MVRGFWRAMGSNDFFAAAAWLAEDYVLTWPQSGEVMHGREAFGRVNTEYPSAGRWRFKLRRILAEGPEVVTEVEVTDGNQEAVAITFHTIVDDKISRQREFWPDPFPAPPWRSAWVSVGGET